MIYPKVLKSGKSTLVRHVFDQKKYVLNIIASWREEDDTEYEFELNYYSPDNMEFLFNYKIFNNIHSSLNYIEHEIENLN